MNALDIALSYSGPVLGVLAILTGVVCLVVSRRHRAAVDLKQSELESIIRQNHGESTRGIVQMGEDVAQLNRTVADLQLNARNIEEAGWGGLTRTRRAQAMQLLRSGMPPETAASNLGMATREMRLISRVSRILSLQ